MKTDLKSILFLSGPDYDLPRKNITDELKAIIYCRHYDDETFDFYYRMQLTSKEIEYNLGNI